jgi:hypothetical protein
LIHFNENDDDVLFFCYLHGVGVVLLADLPPAPPLHFTAHLSASLCSKQALSGRSHLHSRFRGMDGQRDQTALFLTTAFISSILIFISPPFFFNYHSYYWTRKRLAIERAPAGWKEQSRKGERTNHLVPPQPTSSSSPPTPFFFLISLYLSISLQSLSSLPLPFGS